MENVSHDTSFEEDYQQPSSRFMNTSEILINTNEPQSEGSEEEMQLDTVEEPPYKETHFYALLLFFDVVNGVFRSKDEIKMAFDKIQIYR